MAWVLLAAAAAFEIAFALTLKSTEGFTRLGPSLAVLVLAGLSVFLLSRTLDQLPVGTAYAAWTGIGAIGTVALGVVFFDETATALRLGCIALILVGVVGLNLSGA